MRILQISSAGAYGGGERHLADLTNALAARGHEVYAALRPHAPVAARLTALPASNIICLPLRNALDVPSGIALSRFAREKEIQIIHAHMARDYALAAFARRRAARARLVLTRHVLFPLGGMSRWILRHAEGVIAVSEAVAEALRAQAAVAPARLRVIPNGLDFSLVDATLDGFEREEYRRRLAPEARFLVGTVGELSHVKGQDVFVRAAALVAGSIEQVEFLVVGEDSSRDEETRAHLTDLIARTKLTGSVRLMGRRDDLPQLLSALDLFVSASRSEAFGLAILEAMGCGTCVVATATGGARSLIEDGVSGRLVPVDDAQALGEAIISLLQSEAERARLQAGARREARTRFDLKRMVEATERLYEEILAG